MLYVCIGSQQTPKSITTITNILITLFLFLSIVTSRAPEALPGVLLPHNLIDIYKKKYKIENWTTFEFEEIKKMSESTSDLNTTQKKRREKDIPENKCS